MMNVFQVIPTELHLNGPNVGFSSVPLDASASITGVATFVAISTASFPYNNVNGSFTFDWYFDNQNIKDISVDGDSRAFIDTDVALGISTITISGIDGNDDGKSIFVITNYIPGPDENIIDYPAEGIGKSTSRTATLTAPPSIEISKQPTSVVIGSGNTATFEVEASVIPGGGNITYQWQLEGTNLINGTSTRTVQESGGEFPTMNVTSDAGDSFTLNWAELSTYDSFEPGRTYTLTSVDSDIIVDLDIDGATGGGNNGGKGGNSTGRITLIAGKEYKVVVGTRGIKEGRSDISGGGSAGNDGYSGGGFTGIFDTQVSHGNSILIAGGGGGAASRDLRSGGAGGGLEGASGEGGGGGTQTGGGAAFQYGGNGSELKGGDSISQTYSGGGGGGGYYGGGSARGDSNFTPGPYGGGGGSGFIHPTLITDGTTTTAGASRRYGNGIFRITRVSTPKVVTTRVTGANTPTLTIFSDDEDFGGGLICRMTAENVIESPVFSNTVSYDVVPARSILNFEAYDNDNNYSSLQQNLDLSKTFTLKSSTFGTQYGIIQFHGGEKDTPIRLNINGGAGASNGSNAGGQGGTSTIDFTAKRNIEYTVIGISNNSAIFIYEKSTLIVVVGEGGDAGTGNGGGSGGGINIAGDNGSGTGAGSGGSVPDLTVNGVFGSIVNDYVTPPTLYSGDSIQTTPNGGKTITCSKGSYWINQGISACSDNSSTEIKFVNTNGTTITDSASISRGFKPGYTITDTRGRTSSINGGNGGTGATGGNGATKDTAGGGGGSGYSNGTVAVISANLGGNTSTNSSITFGLQTDLNPVPAQTQTVNFSVTREAANSNTIIFELTSGFGPSQLNFGPNSGTVSANIARGSVYSLVSAPGRLRLSGNTLQLEDSSDDDFNDLTVTPNRGNFQNTSTYIADF